MSQIKDMQRDIVEWADSIIPDRLPEHAFAKLLEEVEEWSKRPCDGHEMADVLILIFDVCHLVGIDMEKALKWKMRINEGRTWELNEDGTMSHVRDEDEDK